MPRAKAKAKPMIVGEQVLYRTVRMTRPTAEAYVKMLEALPQRFHQVTLNQSEKAKGPKAFYVLFAPVRAEGKEALLEGQRHDRRGRAADRMEEGSLLFWQDPDRRWLYHCFSTHSGETYVVTDHDCECPDYVCRCRRIHLPCIHMEALTLYKIAEDSLAPYPTREPGDITPSEHRRAVSSEKRPRYYEEQPLTRAEREAINALIAQDFPA